MASVVGAVLLTAWFVYALLRVWPLIPAPCDHIAAVRVAPTSASPTTCPAICVPTIVDTGYSP